MLLAALSFSPSLMTMRSGAGVKLRACPLHSEEKLVLTISRDRRYYLGNVEIAPLDLEAKLTTNARIQKDKELYLHADRSLPYGQVVEVMAIARRAGVESLGMITEPDKELRKP